MRYEIVYKGEVVDTAKTLKEALFLSNEYRIAFNHPIKVRESNER